MVLSKIEYKSLRRLTMSSGELSSDKAVKPTISEKYTVTSSNISASTDRPFFRCSAIDLKSYRII